MNITNIAKILIVIGVIIILSGAILWLMGKIDLGWRKLPGDTNMEVSKGSFQFPLTTSIILSIVLTIVVNLILWLMRKE